MDFNIVHIDKELRERIINFISKNWGSSKVVTRGKIHDVIGLPGFVAISEGEVVGVITYFIEARECEIVTLDSIRENNGIGSSLIEEVISVAKKQNCKRVWLITTNDNIHAIRYYQKRGFDLVAVYRNTIAEARKIKPQIPMVGFEDITILHEIEFEKVL